MARFGPCSRLVCALLITAQPAVAGRPLVIDDAAPVASGKLETELGLLHIRPQGGGREQNWPVIGLTYGLLEWLDIALNIQRVNRDLRHDAPVQGFEDLRLGGKLRLIQESRTLPAVSFSLDVELPTANKSKGLSTGKSSESFTLILSKSYAPASIDLNLRYLVAGKPKESELKNVIGGGIAADYALRPGLALVGEVYAASRAESGAPNEAAFQLGMRYAVTPRFVLDAAAGRSLRNSGAAIQGTAGLTWTIDTATILPFRH